MTVCIYIKYDRPIIDLCWFTAGETRNELGWGANGKWSGMTDSSEYSEGLSEVPSLGREGLFLKYLKCQWDRHLRPLAVQGDTLCRVATCK